MDITAQHAIQTAALEARQNRESRVACRTLPKRKNKEINYLLSSLGKMIDQLQAYEKLTETAPPDFASTLGNHFEAALLRFEELTPEAAPVAEVLDKTPDAS